MYARAITLHFKPVKLTRRFVSFRILVARGVLIAMLAVGWSANQVWADTVTFHFTGTVTNINPAFIDAIGGTEVVDVGDKITGSFTYDLDTPGTTGGTGPGGIVIRTDYFSPVPPGNMTYSVGRLTVKTEPGSEFFVVIVGNGMPSNIEERDVDTFIVGAASSIPTTLESVFRLEDTTQSVFSDTTLPTSLNLEAFDLRRFEVYKIDTFANLIFEASIDTISTDDHCPNSIVSPTVVINGCDSEVPNTIFPDGCTISDLIGACAEGASNHGQFMSCVSHLTNDLKKAGTITGQQKGAIQSCAAKAHIP